MIELSDEVGGNVYFRLYNENGNLLLGDQNVIQSWTCPLSGTYYIRCHESGSDQWVSYNIRVLPAYWNGTAAWGDDHEPDENTYLAREVRTDGTVYHYANLNSADRDWVRFTAKQGTTYTFTLSNESGGTYYFRVCDQAERIFSGNQNTSWVWTCPATGAYYVMLWDYDDNQIGSFDFSISGGGADYTVDIPQTNVALYSDAAFGETAYNLVATSSNGSDQLTWASSDPSVVTVDAAGHIEAIGVGTAIITVTCTADGSSDQVTVTVNADDFEPNDTLAEAKPIAVGRNYQSHYFKPKEGVTDQFDWLQFEAVQGHGYVIELADEVGVNVACSLYDEQGSALTGSIDKRQEWTCPVSGTYFISVWSSSYQQYVSYRIRVLPAYWNGNAEWDNRNEPDDNRYTAREIRTDGTVYSYSNLDCTEDDWVRFTAQEGKVYTITQNNELQGDFVFVLYDHDQVGITGWTNGSYLWTCPVSGTYYLLMAENGRDQVGSFDVSISSGSIDYVVDIPIEHVSLYMDTADGVDGYSLTANCSNGSDQITWASSDEAVATVDENGFVNAIGPGHATITATCTVDGSKDFAVVVVSADNGEPDNVLEQAGPIEVGPVYRGRYFRPEGGPSDQFDWLRFDAIEGYGYVIELANEMRTNVACRLYDERGNPLTGNIDTRQEWSCPITGIYYISVWSSSYTQYVSYSIRVLPAFWNGDAEWDEQHEPDNARYLARQIQTDGTICHYSNIDRAENDWVRFTASAGNVYTMLPDNELYGDYVLQLYDSSGTALTNWLQNYSWTCPDDGTYFVALAESGRDRIGSFDFRITAQDTNYAVDIALEEVSLYLSTDSGMDNYQLVASCSNADCNIIWESSDESVVVVDQSGMLNAVGVGTAVVSAVCSIDGVDYFSDDISITVHDINEGLVGYYPFEGSFSDMSGIGNHSTEHGGVSYSTDRFGNEFSSCVFDGIDDYLSIPSNPSLNPADQLTLSFWIKVDSYTNAWSPIIHKGGPASISYTNREYTVWLNNSGYFHFASAGDGGGTLGYSSTTQQTDRWLNYAAVIDRRNHLVRVFINGEIDVEAQDNYSTFNNNDHEIRIGWSEEINTSYSHFNGALDDIRIYNRALSPYEIEAIYSIDDADHDGVQDVVDNCPEIPNPNQADLDEDGIGDLCDDDIDGDGLVNESDPDDDNDGMPDEWEIQYGLNPYEDDTDGDADSDGFTNLEEYLNSTNPTNSDSIPAGVHLSRGLVAEYLFAGNALDSSGNGNDGTEFGGIELTNDRFGNPENAYYFDGIDDYVEIFSTDALNPRTITLAAWVNPTTLSQSVIDHIVLNKEEQYEVAVFSAAGQGAAANEIAFAFNPDWYWYGANYFPDLNEFFHIAITFNTSHIASVFVNGEKTTEMEYSGPIMPTDNCLRIGARGCPDAASKLFNGVIDDIYIYSRALSEDEIYALYSMEDIDHDNVLDSVDNCPETYNPDQADLDEDGLGDLCDDDVDGDGLLNDSDPDDDNDGMPDNWEIQYGLNPYFNDADEDADFDEFTNIGEYVAGTNPVDPDSHPVDLNRGLVAYYPFNGNANDESGNGNDGIENGGVSFAMDRFGYSGGAYHFDGVDDFIDLGNDGVFNIHDQITISFWINANSYAGHPISKWKTEQHGGSWSISLGSGLLYFHLSGDGSDGSYYAQSDIAIDIGRYHLITGVYQSHDNQIRIYIDGIEHGVADGQVGSIFISDAKIYIGAADYYLGVEHIQSYFNGAIDDVRIYNRALSPIEIQELYNIDGPLDIDGDGIPNGWEEENGLNPSDSGDAQLDFDNDGLSNLEEYFNRTNPHNSDTDEDGMPDGWEVDNGLDPLADDAGGHADGDTLSNLEEYFYHTDPTNADTDGDVISDSDEIANGTNPLAMTSSLTTDTEEMTLSVGTGRTVLLRLENTRREVDLFEVTVSGIDATWCILTQTEIALTAGEIREIPIEIQVPADCDLTVFDYTIHVSAESPDTGLVANGGTDMALHVVNAPIISNLTPETGEVLGTNAVQIAWQTDAESTSDLLYYRIAGETEYLTASGDPGTAHQVTLEGLTWDSTYEWYVASEGPCDTAQSDVRTFTVQDGVVFTERNTSHTIQRDYDQTITVAVYNRDAVAHTALLEVTSPDEELIAGFVGSGSQDQTLTLSPGETAQITLALHAQDTSKDQYLLDLKLTADADTGNPIVDYTRATINIRAPDIDFSLVELSHNPAILTNTYRLTNNGDTVTDFRVFAEEAAAAQIVFQPQIDHMLLATNQSIEFTATFQPTDAMTQFTGNLYAAGAGHTETLLTTFGCESGTSLFDVSLSDVHTCMQKASWYCTNRPVINVNFDLPAGIESVHIDRARLYINFSLRIAFGTYRNHDVYVKLNDTVIASYINTIPTGPHAIDIPVSLIRTGSDGIGRNRVTLETRHMNGGHYAIASDFQMILDLNTYNGGTVCAVDQTEADLAALNLPFICDGTPTWQPVPQVSSVTALDAVGNEKPYFIPGETLQVRVALSNPDLESRTCDLNFVLDNNFDFGTPVLEETRPFTLAPGASTLMTFWWTVPQDALVGFYHARTTLACPAEDPQERTFTNIVSLYQPVTGYTITPVSHDFGTVDMGDSASRMFTVTNTGDLTIDIGDITVSGDPDFSLADDACTQSALPAGASCSFTLLFSPTDEGSRSATVSVPVGTDAAGLPVIGNGVSLVYTSPRLLSTQWSQPKITFDANSDGTLENYVTGCTSVAVGQLINYYLKAMGPNKDEWLQTLLQDVIVYPRFQIDTDPIQYWVLDFMHPGCDTLSSYADTHDSGPFGVSTTAPCDEPENEPVINFLWNVALGLDSQFEENEGTGTLSYGASLEPYHWVGDDTQQKIKSVLVDRFRFNGSYDEIQISNSMTQLNEERDYITSSIDSGHPVLITMYGPDGGHAAVIDQYRIEANDDFKVRINMGWGPDMFDENRASGQWYGGDGLIDAAISDSGHIEFTSFYIFKNTRPNLDDIDHDGMPNDWEAAYGLNPSDPADASDDPDLDDLTNLEEYQNGTNPNVADTDGDGMPDGDEIEYGTNPTVTESVHVQFRDKNVVVSLTGDNRIFIEVTSSYAIPKAVELSLSGLDSSWYTISEDDQNFVLLPFGRKRITAQLHLPDECEVAGEHPFSVNIYWNHQDNIASATAESSLVITANPNIYRLAIPENTALAGNTILLAWKTDVPSDGVVFYRQVGEEEWIEVDAGTDTTEHRVALYDLNFFTYYEYYTESRSSCNGLTRTDQSVVKTGKAVKFLNDINEFWVDRDYNQLVTLTVTNTDMVDHDFQLSLINDNEDIVVDFVGDGSNGRTASLAPGESTEVELVVHAPDAQKTLYDIYLQMVSDADEVDSFVDLSHAIVHVRPFVANLDIQPIESLPGLMTAKFRLINYGDPLGDIEVFVDENNLVKTWMAPEIHHARLVPNPNETEDPNDRQFIEFEIHAQEHTTGTVYARSGDYVVQQSFEIGCPDGTFLDTYTLNDFSIMAEIKDWYCTNKRKIDLPFTVPSGLTYEGLDAAAVEFNFYLPMAIEKYDPHTVVVSVNGQVVETLEDTIPQGQYVIRIPKSYIHLGYGAPASNYVTLEAQGIGTGQYIEAIDFRVILNISEMQMELCTPPPPEWTTPRQILPQPKTKIVNVGPKNKLRPGDDVELYVNLFNNDDSRQPYHQGRLIVTLNNNSFGGKVPVKIFSRNITIVGGEALSVRFYDSPYHIPDDADDIDYTISATFENFSLGETEQLTNRDAFYVRTPLVIIHGIKGSYLKENDSLLWINLNLLGKNVIDQCDEWLNRLEFYHNGQEWVSRYGITVDGTIKELWPFINAFKGLEDYLVEDNRYNIESAEVRDKDIFYFAYDWRQDNKKSAVELTSYLELLSEQVSYDKINIVSHSMGGLVTKSFLENYSTDISDKIKVNKTMFVGTPHLGAPDAFPALKYGFDVAAGMYTKLSKRIYLDAAEKFDAYLATIEDLVKVADTIANPSASALIEQIRSETGMLEQHQPLGPEDCSNADIFLSVSENVIGLATELLDQDLNDVGIVKNSIGLLRDITYLYSIDMDVDFINDYRMKTISGTWPSLYQLLPSQRYMSEISSYYEHNDASVTEYFQMKSVINDVDGIAVDLVDNAESFHSNIDSMNARAFSNRTYAIIGCRKPTTTIVSESDLGQSVSFVQGDGDGRVPVGSAIAIETDRKYAAFGAAHAGLPSQKGVQKLIRSLLKGYETGYDQSLFHPVVEYCDECCKLSGMRIKIEIPPGGPGPGWIWPEIVGGGGKITFTGNGIHLGIIGSDYQITNEGVVVYVPEGEIYQLNFKGVDPEYLRIKFQMMTEGGILKTYVFSDLTLDMGACGQVTFDLTNAMTDPVLRLDQDCDGTYETEGIPPTDILDEEESADEIAPVTIADVEGTVGENGWYISDVTVSLNATDQGGSGLLATRYRLSGDEQFLDYAGPILFTDTGDHTLYYYSIDRNLNREVEKVLTIRIEDAAPRIVSVTDGEFFVLDDVDLCWEIETSVSALQRIEYSVGTAPGLTDVRGWTDTGSTEVTACVQIAGLPASCDVPLYFNLRAANGAGRESEVVSSDGVVVLAAGADPDGDTFANELELAAGSNPCNAHSIPKDSTLTLKKGFNLVSIPAEIMFRPDLRDWLETFGGSTEIEKVMVYDAVAGKYVTMVPDAPANPSYILQGGEGLIVYSFVEKTIPFTSALCAEHDLRPGVNDIGIPCAAGGYRAFDLLTELGAESAASIQRFNATTGTFESAGFRADGSLAGRDFPIVPGEGYFLKMKQAVDEVRF